MMYCMYTGTPKEINLKALRKVENEAQKFSLYPDPPLCSAPLHQVSRTLDITFCIFILPNSI